MRLIYQNKNTKIKKTFTILYMIDINDAWYRVSAKALIYNDKWQILLCKESNGTWDIPGGWLDHGENARDCIKRELIEEMWLEVTSISSSPVCFATASKESSKSRPWIWNICYKALNKLHPAYIL